MPPDVVFFTRKMPVLEREIKLYVPVARQAAIEQELAQRQAEAVSLHALYFDTAQRELAQAGIALRLRLEGTQWVQTLKMAGPDELSRIELNHDRPEARLDLSVYSDAALIRILRKLRGPLVQRYETQVERRQLRLSTPGGTIDLAYDTGLISAGGLTLPVSELELEYVDGALTTLFDVSKQWLEKYSLILDLRSKAERGDGLANLAAQLMVQTDTQTTEQMAPLRKARKASLIQLSNDLSITQAYLACANDCLNQIVRNSAYLAGVDNIAATAEQQVGYTHQARVGIRRLRSCWRFFDGWLDLDDDALAEPLRPAFVAFGKARDMDVIREDIAPCLVQAGMPQLQAATDQPDYTAQTTATAAHPSFQSHLLDLAQHLFALSDQHATEASGGKKRSDQSQNLRKTLTKKLSNWQTKIATEGVLFKLLSCEQQHDLRKKIKRLRYTMEFSDSLLKDSEFEHTLPILVDAQHILGDMNDLYTALPYYESLTGSQPQAWFAVGWLKATQADLRNQAQRIFEQLALTTLSNKKLNAAVIQATASHKQATTIVIEDTAPAVTISSTPLTHASLDDSQDAAKASTPSLAESSATEKALTAEKPLTAEMLSIAEQASIAESASLLDNASVATKSSATTAKKQQLAKKKAATSSKKPQVAEKKSTGSPRKPRVGAKKSASSTKKSQVASKKTKPSSSKSAAAVKKPAAKKAVKAKATATSPKTKPKRA